MGITVFQGFGVDSSLINDIDKNILISWFLLYLQICKFPALFTNDIQLNEP
jgi:hypothetical protein